MHHKLKMSVFVGLLAFAFTGCSTEPTPQKNNDLSEKVEVNWTWKRTVSKSANVVYGTVKNKTDQPLAKVELEFRTQNEQGETIQTRLFSVENIEPKGQKPFTKDYPAQSAKEDSGFVSVKNVIAAN